MCVSLTPATPLCPSSLSTSSLGPSFPLPPKAFPCTLPPAPSPISLLLLSTSALHGPPHCPSTEANCPLGPCPNTCLGLEPRRGPQVGCTRPKALLPGALCGGPRGKGRTGFMEGTAGGFRAWVDSPIWDGWGLGDSGWAAHCSAAPRLWLRFCTLSSGCGPISVQLAGRRPPSLVHVRLGPAASACGL